MRLRHDLLRASRVAALALPLLLLAGWRTAGLKAPGYVVIVNAANPGASASKSDVMRLFMKKARAWPHGASADPVDQKDSSPVRAAFLADVMTKDASAMRAYWQSQVFVGRTTPPPVKAGDAEVIAHVANAPGGIGYVSPSATLPETVKVLKVE